MKNIVLIGMPASGKSTVGVILAKILGMDFIDTDIVIQQREHAKLDQIISERGIDGFLQCEEEALMSIQADNTVISTGGSAVYSDKAMQYLAQSASIVYLKVELARLQTRLNNLQERGVVLQPGETIENLYETRSVLYEKYADITISEEGLSVEETVRKVMKEVQ